MIQQRPFDCPAAAVRVTVYRQTFMVSGVGSSTTIKQHDHDCSCADGKLQNAVATPIKGILYFYDPTLWGDHFANPPHALCNQYWLSIYAVGITCESCILLPRPVLPSC